MPRNSCLALLACLLAWIAGCAPIRFGEQELWLRHDPKADTLDVLIVYDSIQTTKKEDDDSSFQFATRVSGGRRELMIFDWPLHFDLEKLSQEEEELADAGDPWTLWERELRACAKSVSVVSAGYCNGRSERLSMYQHLRIANASRAIALLEQALYIGILECVAAGSLESDTPLLDAASRELWTAMAKDKRRWLSLKDGVLEVDLPLTPASAADLSAYLLRKNAQDDEFAPFVAGLASHLSEVTVADERAVLRWKLVGPTFTFEEPRDHQYDDGLAKSIHRRKALALPTRSKVIQDFTKD